ncbi:hypothetical protein QTN25_002467 [Entamoeba marina]
MYQNNNYLKYNTTLGSLAIDRLYIDPLVEITDDSDELKLSFVREEGTEGYNSAKVKSYYFPQFHYLFISPHSQVYKRFYNQFNLAMTEEVNPSRVYFITNLIYAVLTSSVKYIFNGTNISNSDFSAQFEGTTSASVTLTINETDTREIHLPMDTIRE